MFNYKSNAAVKGVVITRPAYSHTTHGKHFYAFTVSTRRLSGKIDEVYVFTCERPQLAVGDRAMILGELRVSREHRGTEPHCIVHIYAAAIEAVEDKEDYNGVALNGTLVKNPVIRSTPSGRTIIDICVAVTRKSGIVDYVPCIAWESSVDVAKRLSFGSNVVIKGRIQSREYIKRYADDTHRVMTAREVSVNHIDIILEDNR